MNRLPGRRLALLLPLLLAAPAGAAEPLRLSASLPLAAGAPVAIELPAADVHLEGHDGDRLEVEMVVHCSGGSEKCREAVADLALASGGGQGAPVVWLGGGEAARGDVVQGPLRLLSSSEARRREDGSWAWPQLTTPGRRLSLELTFRLPRGHPLELSLGEGNVLATGLRSSTTLRVERGRVRILLPQGAAGAVRLQTGEGFTELRRDDQASLMGDPIETTIFGTRLEWEGEGEVDLEVESGRGDIVVQLR